MNPSAVSMQESNCSRQGVGVFNGNDEAVLLVANDFFHASGVADDRADTLVHRFEQRLAQSLGTRGHHEQIGPTDELGRIGTMADQTHAVADPQVGGQQSNFRVNNLPKQ